MGGTYGNLVARLLVSGILKMNWVLDRSSTAMEGSDYSLDSPIKRIVLRLCVVLISRANEFSHMHFIYLIIWSARGS